VSERGTSRAATQETSVFDNLTAQRLVAVFVAGWLLFSFPLLALWDREATVFGVPLFPAALFGAWALVIALAAWVVERGEG
jgi:hypothetical protein